MSCDGATLGDAFCRDALHIATIVLCGAAVFGCASDTTAALCTPGMVVECPCGGGARGAQTCGADGVFSGCMCPDASAPDVATDAPSDRGVDVAGDVPPDLATDVSLDAASDLGVDVAADGRNDALDVEPDVLPDVPSMDVAADIACATGSLCGSACLDLTSDTRNCGRCGNDCTALTGVNASAIRCVAGACDLTAGCLAGRAHCSTDPRDGCETDVTTPSRCGGCSARCDEPTPLCSVLVDAAGGRRYACASGCPSTTPSRCAMTCVDTNADPAHCGDCTTACATPAHGAATCRAAACGFTCNAGFHVCGTGCADNASTATCGAACTPCLPPANATATCDGSACGFTCNSGFVPSGAGCSAPVEACNFVDDDGDGLVDEGFGYVEASATSRRLDAAPFAGLWWSARAPGRVAFSWGAGAGIPSDNIFVQVMDYNGSPTAAASSFTGFQSSNWNAIAWLGDRFFITGTTRDYDCGGGSSSSCTTYGLAVDSSGARMFGPSVLMVGTPNTGGMVGMGEQFLVTSIDAGSSAVRVRSFTRSGAAGGTDRTLIAPGVGETISSVRGASSADEIYWVYRSSVRGLQLLVTTAAAVPVRGPYTLRSSTTTVIPERGGSLMAIDAGVIYLGFTESGTGYLGRWTTSGSALGAPTPIPGGVDGVDLNGGQLYAVAPNASGPTVTRLSLSGMIVQPATPVLAGLAYSTGIAATGSGAIVMGSNYSPGRVGWARFACP